MPWLADSDVAFTMTRGTASPSACGQAITRTVTARSTTNAISRPAAAQLAAVAAPDPIAINVSQYAARSASA